MVGKGLVVPVKVKLEAEAKDAEDFAKSILSHLDLGKAFKSQNFSDIDTYLKQSAYDKTYKKTGDEEEAKKAAESAGLSNKETETLGIIKELSGVMKSFGNSLISFVQGMFGVVEDIYKQLKKSSPLLEMIENLFNLAVTLFFMPLGNKLAEVMLPAIINMLDAVMDIWDKFEGKTLGEMFSIAITEGVQLVASYLMDLGSLLEEEGGIVGSIGSLLNVIGDFLQDDGARLIEFASKIFSFLMDNVGKILVIAAEFFIAAGAAIAGIYAYLMARVDPMDVLSKAAASTAAATVLYAGNAAFWGTGIAGDLWNMAEGGYVPATPGGKAIRIAEAGEGEYVIPESKFNDVISLANVFNSSVQSYNTTESQYMVPMTNATSQTYEMNQSQNMQREITNNFYFEGLTNDDLKMIIREEVDNMVSQSKYRGGY